MPFQLRVKGSTLSKELTWASTLFAREYSNQAPLTIVNSLLGLANKPWSSFVDGGLQTQTARFDFPSSWEALEHVAQTANIHIRQTPSIRGLELGAFGAASGVVLISPDTVSPAVTLNENIGLITSLNIVDESQDIWNRLIPIGQGEGNNLWTLKYSTRTTPYTIHSAGGPNGQPYYYIEDTYSINRYGLRTRAVSYKDVGPISNSVLGFQLSSNALYDLGVADLIRSKDPLVTYSVGVTDIRSPVREGDTVRVIWNGITNDGPTVQSFTKTLRPRADGYYNNFSGAPSVNAYQQVDEETADDDTTYISHNTGLGTSENTFLYPASGVVGNISSVTLWWRARRVGSGGVTVGPVYRRNGQDWLGFAQAVTGSYANYSHTLTLNPITGREWTIDDLEMLETGVRSSVVVADTLRVTQVWVVVNFSIGGRRAYRSLNEDLVVLEKKRAIRSNGERQWNLTLATVPRWRMSDEELIIGAIETLNAFKSAVKPYTFQADHGSERDSIQASGSRWFTYDIKYDNNIHAVLKVELDVQLTGVKSNVQEAAQGQLSTSSSGGSHSHSVGSQTSSANGAHGHVLEVNNTGGPAHNSYYGGRTWYAEDWSPGSWHFHALLDSHHHYYGGGATVTYQNHSHTIGAQTSSSGGSHNHTVPAHDHAIVYGIYVSSRASAPAIQVWINSVDRTADLGGPWNSDFTVDITEFVVDSEGRPAWGTNRVQFRKPSTSPDFIDLIAHATSMVVATALAPV